MQISLPFVSRKITAKKNDLLDFKKEIWVTVNSLYPIHKLGEDPIGRFTSCRFCSGGKAERATFQRFAPELLSIKNSARFNISPALHLF